MNDDAPPPSAASYRVAVRERRWLAPGTFELQLERPPGFRFVAGQFLRVRHGKAWRNYTLVGGPDDDYLAHCIRHVDAGFLTPRLAAAEPGAQIEIDGPHGYFVYQSQERPAIFVATGTGVAPFVAMARAGIRDFTLLHGVATAAELYYAELFSAGALRYVPCVSGDNSASRSPAPVFAGRVTAYARERIAGGPYDFYLCGRGEMIREMMALIDERFPDSRVYTEMFF